ncbi:hypothetical protein [Arthrobacter hankyongi]|nr:hypothetical protein [Arthrobacter hankyongi]
MAERPKSLLLPILAAAVVAGLARMVIQKIKQDRRLRQAGR